MSEKINAAAAIRSALGLSERRRRALGAGRAGAG